MTNKRSRRKPISIEARANLSEKARAQHARKRGFAIPEEVRELYYSMKRRGIQTRQIWQRLGLAVSLVMTVLLLFASSAQAQMKCGALPMIELWLMNQFGEMLVGRGLNDNSQVRLYTSTTGTWSVIAMAPSKMACIVQSGQAWEFAKPGKAGKQTGLPLVLAHDAPSGWTYPANCCGKLDCTPLPANALKPTPTGWQVIATGEIIPFAMTRKSGDGQNHRCVYQGAGPQVGKTRHAYDKEGQFFCLYVADPGI